VEHEATDGLKAHPEGLLHGVILRVPVSVMEKAGVYRFVLHFYDDYADSYKNHQVKAALEVNILIQQRYGLVILIDDSTPTGTGGGEISTSDLRQVLTIVFEIFNNRLGIPTLVGIEDLIEPTESLGAHQLKPSQKRYVQD
ncbi:MAG: hypothetical protein C4295_06350, partial [Candidatus Fervidibacterota bacterium]